MSCCDSPGYSPGLPHQRTQTADPLRNLQVFKTYLEKPADNMKAGGQQATLPVSEAMIKHTFVLQAQRVS